jgi:hypothetical protein
MAGNLPVQLPDLSQLMGPVGGYAMGQQKDMAFQNNQMNQDAALQDLLFQRQNDPIKLRQAGLAADTTEAQLPGVQADSWQKTRNQQVREGIPLDTEQKAQLSKIATQMSDEEWKQTENALQQAAIDPSPRVREWASSMIPHLKAMQEERLKNKDREDRAQSVETMRNVSAEKIAQMNIDAGKFQKGGGVKSLELTIASAKSARERHQALIDAATVAKQQGNVQLAESYTERAAAIRPQAEAEIANLQPRPGAANLPAMAGIPVNPNISVAPPAPAASSANKYPTPTTQADYDKLPSGTVYIDTDGKTKRKK